MIRKRKRYVRPKRLYEKSRIEEENKLAERYGLKNKREIWKALAKVSYFRRRAKALAKASREEQEVFFAKLRAQGLKTYTIADVLALKHEDILRRRLPTILVEKKLASTFWQARQLVVHKHVRISGKVVNVPSYLVLLDEESAITLDVRRVEQQKQAPASEKEQEETHEQTHA